MQGGLPGLSLEPSKGCRLQTARSGAYPARLAALCSILRLCCKLKPRRSPQQQASSEMGQGFGDPIDTVLLFPVAGATKPSPAPRFAEQGLWWMNHRD